MKSAVFITGATGYIGSKLALKLAQNHKVHVLCRSKAKAENIKHPSIEIFEGDIMDTDSLDQAMKGCQCVYHLASYARVWAKCPEEYFRINVEGTINVLEAARRLEIQKVVVTSTASVFGPSGEGELNEESIRSHGFFNDYETSKFIMEEKIHQYVKNGLEVVMVHPTRVYGPGIDSPSNAVSRLAKMYIQGKWRFLPGHGDMVGNYAFVDDVVKGHILAMDNGRAGEKYILGGPNLSFLEFFRELGQITGIRHRMFKIPQSWMVVFARIQVLLADLFNISPLFTPNGPGNSIIALVFPTKRRKMS